MKDRYFQLRAEWKHLEKNIPYEIKLQDLEAIWFCSRKNAKRILKKLECEGLLIFKPGRGRGKISQIQYSSTFQNEVEEFMKECAKKGELDKIAEVLRLPIPSQWVVNSSSEIRKLLGLKRDELESKDILYTFRARDITTLDPLRVSVSMETHLIEYLGDTLVRYNSEKDCFDPHIAHHFHADEEKRVWTFYLRKSVYFHQGGFVTSRDVAYTINRMQNSPHSYSWLAKNITKIVCPNPQKVEIHLKHPNPFFLRYLSAIHFCILPADIEFNEYKWIGTGPFRLKERTKNKLVLEANDTYFRVRPLIDEIHFHRVTTDAVKTVYLSSDAEVKEVIPTEHKIKDAGLRLLSFNLKRKNVIQHPSFRQAIYHLFDVKKMARELEWEVLEARSFEIENAGPHHKDASKIPSLLAESGYKGESFNLFHFENYHAVLEARWLEKEARNYDISFTLCPVSFTEFTETEIELDLDLLIMGLSLSFDKHLAFSYAFRNKSLLFNRLFDSDIEQYMEAGLNAFEMAEKKKQRARLMEEMEQYLQKQHALIFLYHPVVTRALDPIIENVESHSFGHFDFTKLWVRS